MLVQGRVAVGCASLYNCPEFAKFDDALTGLIAAETRALGPRQSLSVQEVRELLRTKISVVMFPR